MSNSTTLTIAAIQDQWHGSTASTMAALTQRIIDCYQQYQPQIIVLSELHSLPYFCQQQDAKNFAYAESLDGPTVKQLAALAKKFKIVIVGSIFERRLAGMYHNTACVLDTDGSLAGYYRKMHIPDDPGYNEKYYFTPGDLGFKPITTTHGKLGVLVCWDQWFPEAARIMALNGADMLIYPTAIGWDPQDNIATKEKQLHAWRCIQQAHAIANALPVISCNRVGYEQHNPQLAGTEFWGNSFITDQYGMILQQASANQPATIVTTLDLAQTAVVRQAWPLLRDRRIDAYAEILNRCGNFNKIV